jgi:hypothetical protein
VVVLDAAGVGVVTADFVGEGALDALCVAAALGFKTTCALLVATAFVAAGVCAGCVAAGVVCVAPPIGNPPESESML